MGTSLPPPPPRTAKTIPKQVVRACIRWAAEEIGSKGLAACGLFPIKDRTAQLVRYPAAVFDGKAGVTGVKRCGTTYCPVCGPAVAAERAAILDPQIRALMAQGWTTWLATLTLRHERDDDLRALVGDLLKAWAKMTKRARWTGFAKSGAGCRWVRGVDLTHGGPNGAHPHLHVIMLLPPTNTDGDATMRWVFDQWCAETRRIDREARLHGFDAHQIASPAGVAEALAYATSGGSKTKANGNASASVGAAVAAAEVFDRGGSVVIEAVGAAVKSGRGQGRTMADLARDFARNDDKQAIRLWQECVLALKNRRLLGHSDGLTMDAPEGEAPTIEREPVADFAKPGPRQLDRHWRPMVPAADQSVDAMRDVLRATMGDAGGGLWDLPADEQPADAAPPDDLFAASADPDFKSADHGLEEGDPDDDGADGDFRGDGGGGAGEGGIACLALARGDPLTPYDPRPG